MPMLAPFWKFIFVPHTQRLLSSYCHIPSLTDVNHFGSHAKIHISENSIELIINFILNFRNKQTFWAGKLKSIVPGNWTRRIAFIQMNMKSSMQHFIKFGHSFEALVFKVTGGLFRSFLTWYLLCTLLMNFKSFSHFHSVDFTKATIFQLNSFSIHFSFNIQHYYYHHQRFNI